MPTVEEIRAACPDWATVGEVRERTGLPQTNAAHQTAARCLRFWLAKGAVETRKEPDGPRQYRATVTWRGRAVDRTVQPRILAVIRDGMTTRELADAAGVRADAAHKALEKLREKGMVSREGRPAKWSRRDARRSIRSTSTKR